MWETRRTNFKKWIVCKLLQTPRKSFGVRAEKLHSYLRTWYKTNLIDVATKKGVSKSVKLIQERKLK